MDSWTNFGFYNVFSKMFRNVFKTEKKSEKFEKIFSSEKSMKNQNFERFSKNRNFDFLNVHWLFDDFFSRIFFWSRKKYFSNFFKIFFDFEKFYFIFGKNILKSKIWSGIQKSYLESRAATNRLRTHGKHKNVSTW